MPTVTALKTMLQNQIAPGNDVEFLRLLTEADLRLLQYGRWRWTRGRATLTPVSGIITLTANYFSIIGARLDKDAVEVRDEDYEFVPGGRGEVELGVGTTRLIDMGLNDDGLRHYKVTGHIDPTDTVTALLHFSPATLYDPDIPDSDLPDDATQNTRCPDAAALKLMMLGILMEEALDHGSARAYIADALRTLDAKEQAARGNAVRTITPRSGGVRGIRSFR